MSLGEDSTETPEPQDFAELGDLWANVLAGRPGAGVEDAAQGVQDALAGAGGLVTASGHHGVGVERGTGAAGSVPVVGDVHVVHDRIDFAAGAQWNQLLRAYGDA